MDLSKGLERFGLDKRVSESHNGPFPRREVLGCSLTRSEQTTCADTRVDELKGSTIRESNRAQALSKKVGIDLVKQEHVGASLQLDLTEEFDPGSD